MVKIDLKRIYSIVKKLQATNSRNDKMAILSKYKEDQEFRYILNFAFNDFIAVGIGEKKLNKFINSQQTPTRQFNDFQDLLEYLIANPTGKDEVLINVSYFLNNIKDNKVKKFVIEVIIKNLSIGMTAKSINSAFCEKNFIPVWGVLKGHKFIDSKKVGDKRVPVYNYKKHEGKDIIITKKYDGNRCLICVDNNQNVIMRSDSGRIMEGFSEIINGLTDRLKENIDKGFVLDCELLAKNPEGLNSKDLFRKTQTIVRKKGEKPEGSLDLFCFDYIPLDDFMNGESKFPCSKRKYAAERMIKFMDLSFLHYVYPLYQGMYNKEIINQLFQQAIDNKDEGIIIQLANSPYRCKRGYDLLKMKANGSADLLVTGVYPGKIERTRGTLGGIYLDWHGYMVSCGGGFSDAERELYFNNPKLIVGKIAEISYMEETSDKDGNLSLRHPQFRRIREEKTEPSYN